MKSNKKVGELLGFNSDLRSYKPHDSLESMGMIGIEVELEGMGGYSEDELKFWRVIGDGSLRDNGLEFVLRCPLSGEDLIRSLDELEGTILEFKRETGKTPSLSERTSLHTHVDVRDLDQTQLIHFYLLFTIFEKSFFRIFGEGDRISNNYCTPTFASGKVDTVNSLIRGGNSALHDVTHRSSKYSSLNLKSVSGLGSLEARLHRATWSPEEILQWIKVLLSLKEYVIHHPLELDELSSSISMEGFTAFMSRLFRGDEGVIGLLTYPEMHGDILDGIRVAQDMMLWDRVMKGGNGLSRKTHRTVGAMLKSPSPIEKFCLANDIDFEGEME